MERVVASDLEGTLTAGSTWRGVGRYLSENGSKGAYRLFLYPRLPLVWLARRGWIDVQAFRERWMRDLTRLLGGWTEARIDEMAAWVLEHELWPERREVVIAELAAARDEGARLILASGTYQPVLRAFAERNGGGALGTGRGGLGRLGCGHRHARDGLGRRGRAPRAGPGARRPRARLAHPRRACGGIPARSDMNATGAASPAIRTENLGRRFGDLWAIRGVDLELRGGEVFGLLGPNGAGKTTTVRVLSALIAPSEGRAWVDGFDVRGQPEGGRRRIGTRTETPGL